jgi:hypothetical protein
MGLLGREVNYREAALSARNTDTEVGGGCSVSAALLQPICQRNCAYLAAQPKSLSTQIVCAGTCERRICACKVLAIALASVLH